MGGCVAAVKLFITSGQREYLNVQLNGRDAPLGNTFLMWISKLREERSLTANHQVDVDLLVRRKTAFEC